MMLAEEDWVKRVNFVHRNVKSLTRLVGRLDLLASGFFASTRGANTHTLRVRNESYPRSNTPDYN